jgi:hypothetical protein
MHGHVQGCCAAHPSCVCGQLSMDIRAKNGPSHRMCCTRTRAALLAMRLDRGSGSPWVSTLFYARPVFSVSGRLGVLRPLGPIAPLHGEHLCSGHSKRMASRWPDLPHALHRGLGHCALLWPCSWQRSHTSSLYAALLHMCFASTRVAYADSSVWAFAGRTATCTACAAHAVWARASLLAMPRLRAQRTVCSARRVCPFGAIRIRSERKPSVVWSGDDSTPISLRVFAQRSCSDFRLVALSRSMRSGCTQRSGRCTSIVRADTHRSRRTRAGTPGPSCTPPPRPPAQGPGATGAVSAASGARRGRRGESARAWPPLRYGMRRATGMPRATRHAAAAIRHPLPAVQPAPAKRWLDASRQEGESADVGAGERSSRCR